MYDGNTWQVYSTDHAHGVLWVLGISMIDALLLWGIDEWLHSLGHVCIKVAQLGGAAFLRLVWGPGILVTACRYRLLEGKKS